MNEVRMEQFKSNVCWLKEIIPPEDIYDFAEQALMASEFFINELGELIDLREEIKVRKPLATWINNVIGMRVLKENDYKGKINVIFKESKD